jgi:hypothetical protein
MQIITKEDATQCVREALAQIASFHGEIGSFTFQHWLQYHKTVFINAVALCISKKGNQIILNEEMLTDTMTLASFIEFVRKESAPGAQPESNLTVNNGNLHRQ